MKEIDLIGKNGIGNFVICDNTDYNVLKTFRWYGSKEYSKIYAATCFYDKSIKRTKVIKMARFLMCPTGTQEVDHIDGNTLNNCRFNLRLCSHSQNMFNKKKQITRDGIVTKSRFKGVSFQHGKWRAYISLNNRQIHLGCFSEEIEAARAYNEAALNLYGDFARLNEL